MTSTTVDSTTTPKASSSGASFKMPGFLDLSGEVRKLLRAIILLLTSFQLRNKIYRYCFLLDETITIKSTTLASRGCRIFNENEQASAQFLATCHQIHEEGLSILYGENGFCFYQVQTFKAFAVTIGDRARSHLAYIHLESDDIDYRDWAPSIWSRVIALQNLKHLLLELKDKHYPKPFNMCPSLGKGTKVSLRDKLMIPSFSRAFVNVLSSKKGLKFEMRCVVGSSLSLILIVSNGRIVQ